MIGPDTVHPTLYGAEMLGKRICNAITGIWENM